MVFGCIGPCVKFHFSQKLTLLEGRISCGTSIQRAILTCPLDAQTQCSSFSYRLVPSPSLLSTEGMGLLSPPLTSFPDRSSWTTITFPSDTTSATRPVTIQGSNCWMSSPSFLRMNPFRLYSSRFLFLLAIFFWVISSNWSLDTSYSLSCVWLRLYTLNHYVRRHSISPLALDSMSFSVLLRSHHWPLVLT